MMIVGESSYCECHLLNLRDRGHVRHLAVVFLDVLPPFIGEISTVLAAPAVTALEG